MQSVPQSIPLGLLATVPVPFPGLVTCRAKVLSVKVAVTVLTASIVTEHVSDVPVHPPLHPVKIEFEFGAAVKVTEVPWLYVSVQSEPQSIPDGEEVTAPRPVPGLVTVSWYELSEKVAVTAFAVVILTTQVPVPGHSARFQPTNVEPVAGAAVSVTAVP